MAARDNASVTSNGSLFKRLGRKRSTGLSPQSATFASSDAPPWLPPLTDLGQAPEVPPMPSSPSSPNVHKFGRPSNVDGHPPFLNLPASIAPPIVPTSPTKIYTDGPKLPPVVSVGTSLNLDMTKQGFLAVPEELGGLDEKTAVVEKATAPPPSETRPKALKDASPMSPKSSAKEATKSPLFRSLGSFFRRKSAVDRIDATVADAKIAGNKLAAQDALGKSNGAVNPLRRNSYTPPSLTKVELAPSSASQKSAHGPSTAKAEGIPSADLALADAPSIAAAASNDSTVPAATSDAPMTPSAIKVEESKPSSDPTVHASESQEVTKEDEPRAAEAVFTM